MITYCFFFFNDTATTEIYTLSLHDALPISGCRVVRTAGYQAEMELAFAALHQLCASLLDGLTRLPAPQRDALRIAFGIDRKSTRLNSSHANISYAVFCLKKKKKIDSHMNAD